MDCWRLICLVLGSCCLWMTTEGKQDVDTLSTRQKGHRSKGLRSDRLRTVAEWSSPKQAKDLFKTNLLKPMLIERQVGSEGSRLVQEHIKNVMSSYGWDIKEDTFEDDTPLGMKNFNTIIATQNPQAPRKLVFACHHDSKIMKHPFIAATDSAVPCAMMMEIAHHFNQTLWNPNKNMNTDVSMQFWFLDGEEAFVQWTKDDSVYGARHLAYEMETNQVSVGREEIVPEIRTVDVMILLDLIGTETTTFRNFFESTSKLYQRLMKIEDKLNKEGLLEFSSSKKTYFDGQALRGGGIEDDHVPFLQRGVPILHLISYPFPREWHKESDNEQALDYHTINNIGKILRVFVAEYLHLSP